MPEYNDPEVASLRIPPHALEAEQSVLGALLMDPFAFDRVADVIDRDDFYSDVHKEIFKQIIKLNNDGRPVDTVTVCDELQRSNKLEYVGGLEYVGKMVQNVPTSANIRHYAELVRERSILRQLIEISGKIADSAFNLMGRKANEVLDEAEASMLGIAEQNMRGRKQFVHLSDVLAKVVERVEELHARENPSAITGTPTGFIDLDEMTSGMQAGDLIIVAGRPSMGKTAFALNIAEHVALHADKAVAIFSMEMSATQLVQRMLASVARVLSQKLRSGQVTDDDWDRLAEAMGRLNDAPIVIDETPALSVIELRSRARRIARQFKKEKPLGLIVVDYLQLMQSSSSRRDENRTTEISEISRSLKALARELDVPVIALSQLNRSLEQRPNKRPIMSDLRESGAIEQDADVILFIYRDEVYNPDSKEKGIAEINVGKQRNGPIGTKHLAFLGEFTRFENLASNHY
ncbi:MAG: replicative DNA helicase [Burkholderiales bacterium]|jgi:replicative DNA helicase|nr:replicative DNA helicase [Burkholderiales bacterium]